MTEKAILKIGGMHCVRCAAAVEHALRGTKGVASAEVSLEANEGKVNFDPAQVSRDALVAAIEDAGFDAE